MAVRADHAGIGERESLFGQERVLDAHVRHVEEVFELVFLGEIAADDALIGGLDVLAGREVVEDNDDLFGVEDLGKARLLEFRDGDGARDVVAHDDVEVAEDELSRLDRGFPRGSRENFLCQCHNLFSFLCVQPEIVLQAVG